MGGQATTSTGPLQTCTRSRFTGICFWGWEKIDVWLRCVGTHGKGWSKNSDAIFSLSLPMSHLAYLNLTPLLSPQKHVTIVTGYVTGHEGMSGPACNLSMWTSLGNPCHLPRFTSGVDFPVVGAACNGNNFLLSFAVFTVEPWSMATTQNAKKNDMSHTTGSGAHTQGPF